MIEYSITSILLEKYSSSIPKFDHQVDVNPNRLIDEEIGSTLFFVFYYVEILFKILHDLFCMILSLSCSTSRRPTPSFLKEKAFLFTREKGPKLMLYINELSPSIYGHKKTLIGLLEF